MGGEYLLPVNRENRQAAGVEPGERVRVVIELDEKPRVVSLPDELAARLEEEGLVGAWSRLSYTRQKEHVSAIESAKRIDTRNRRIERLLDELR